MDLYCCWSRHQYPAGVLSVWIHLDTKLFTRRKLQQIISQHGVKWTWRETTWKIEWVNISHISQIYWKLTKTLIIVSVKEARWSFSFTFFPLSYSETEENAAALLHSHIHMVWWCEGCQHWDHGIPMLPLCFVPRLPSVPQTTAPPSADGRPTQGQAASVCANSSVSYPVLCLCLCMPSSGFCVTSRKSQEKQKWTLCKQPVTKLLESLSNSLFTLSIMFSVDKLFSTGEGMDSVLSLWYFMPLPPVSQCQPQPDA